MAKIILGTFITNIAGSSQGSTFRRTKNGHSVFNKQNRILRQSLFLNTKIFAIAEIIRGWRLLTQAQRDEWNRQSQFFQFPDKFGNLKTLSGRQLYIKLTSQMSVANVAFVDPFTLDSTNTPITATLSFMNFSNQSVIFEVDYTNPNSVWAVGFKPSNNRKALEPKRQYAVGAVRQNPFQSYAQLGDVLISQFPTAKIGDWFEAHFFGLNASGFKTETFALKFQLH